MWSKSAPSNIALIKYMGKSEGNRPTNSSLSISVEALRTFVVLEKIDGPSDRWEPLAVGSSSEKLMPIELSEVGLQKFLNHLKRVKDLFGISDSFVVRSGNNFPSDCGIASSASSFAALTLAAAEACCELTGFPVPKLEDLSKISRFGSGSSCRSFFKWALWRDEGAVELPALEKLDLLHNVILIDQGKKQVSTSQAHVKVNKSPLFHGRAQRAENRLSELIVSLTAQPMRWKEAYEICWAEFWDMHSLFETCPEPFQYMTKESVAVLDILRGEIWKSGDGPIITMDAGANIHLFWRLDQTNVREQTMQRLSKYMSLSGDLNRENGPAHA